MKFDFNNGRKNDKDKDGDSQEQKRLPDPRSYFTKLYDMVWLSAARRVLLRFQSNATYRFRNFFGLQ